MKTVLHLSSSQRFCSRFSLNQSFTFLLLVILFATGITTAKAGNGPHANGNKPAQFPASVTIDSIPTVSLVADYCVVAGKVRINAKSSPAGASFVWSTGETGSSIDVDIANLYRVIAYFSNGDSATAALQVAQELVINGDFSAGNTGFFSEYGYVDDVAGNAELLPEGLYGVGTNGQDYHPQFFGKDHTTKTQTGNFMIVNGSTVPVGSPPRQRIIWQQSVPVVPNTNYYFSAYAMNINPGSPAQLQFEVNGVLVGTVADLDVAPKPYSDGEVNINNWVRFYSNPTWNSGSNTTAVIRIRNLNTDASGNDFGLDDISFSTLAPFITLVSPTGTDAQTTCINAPITPIVYSVGSGASGHSVLNLPPGITASFDVPNFLTITGTPTVAGNFTYSITTIGTCNPVTVTGKINIPSIWNSWTGAVSTDWSNANNWACGTVPTTITNVIIPASTRKMPQLTATSVCKMLELQPGTTLDLNGQLFTNYGGISGTGVFKGSVLSNLVINAANVASTVKFDQSVPGTSNALNNLTIKGANDSASLDSRIALYGLFSPQAGITTINDTLILRSIATGTASVDVVTGTLAYGNAGKVVVERYFPARRAWRLFTSPLTGTASIFDTWQNGGKYAQGKGTYVSGSGATNPVGANGLDWSPLNNSSLKGGASLAVISNTHTSLSKNRADTADNIPYFIFVRGDRDPANTNVSLSNNTTLSSTGKLQTGRQTFNAGSTTGAYTLIGNPFAAPVDFDKLVLKNIRTHFWVWDPYLNTEQGGYVLVEQIAPGYYEMIPRRPGGMSQILESSQAFYVETASNGPATVTFQEAAKACTPTNLTAFRPLGTLPSFRTDLYDLNENNNTLLLDGVLALFDSSFSMAVDNMDVLKSSNVKEMIAMVRDNKTLTLERRPLLTNNDTVFLRITKTTQRKYRLAFEAQGIDPFLTAFLEDNYTGTKTLLDLTTSSVYDYVIGNNAASADPNRFRIVFKRAAGPLPVTYKAITAKQQGSAVAVSWTVENELNIKKYEVEKSSNGVDFEKVNTTVATGSNGTTTNYKWIDEKPVVGNNYYRVRSVSADGKYEYSKTVVVKIANSNTAAGIKVFPNPTPGDKIGVAFNEMAAGTYSARLLNDLGQTMMITSIAHTAGSSMENLAPGGKLVAGVYQLVITKPDQAITTIKVIVQ